jgi:type IV secretory pathway TrbD component
VAASERETAMNNDALMFAVIFIVATTLICAGVVMVALNRVRDAANVRPRKRGNRYRPAASHRAYKDVI